MPRRELKQRVSESRAKRIFGSAERELFQPKVK